MVSSISLGSGFFGRNFGDFGLANFNGVGVPDSQGSWHMARKNDDVTLALALL